jgi:hypothetical protein
MTARLRTMIFNPRERLAEFSDNCRPAFNEELFSRRTEDIVQEVKNVILSICNRGTYFSIKVLDFELVEDYAKMMELLHAYEETYKNRNKNKTNENKYDFIEIKRSEFVLLVVTYEVTVKEETAILKTLICIPRVVDKYYLYISGNYYLPQMQVVDASTYNNTLSSSKTSLVVLKTLSQPIRMYRRTARLTTTEKDIVEATYFDLFAFNKSARSFKYIFAEFGFMGGMNFLGISGITFSNTCPAFDKDFYVFHNMDNVRSKKFIPKVDLYVRVPRFLFDNDTVTQNAVVAVLDSSVWLRESFEEIYSTEFWKISLGADFHSATVEKGEGIMTSFRGMLDISTKESIHLPEDMKQTIFHLVKWMVAEFSHLKAKDNLNILTKKLRVAEYMASLYAAKLNAGIYRITDIGKKITIDSLRKALVTDPMCLIKQISKCSLVGFKNIVTDVDATEALKFTVKGQSGLGDNSSNSIPMIYRHTHESYPGIVDLNTASATDPGVTGIICPTAKTYNGFFSEFEEPNFWPETYANLLEEYHRMVGQREIMILKSRIDNVVDENIRAMDDLLKMAETNIDRVASLEQKSIDGHIDPVVNTDGSIDLCINDSGE